jgi:hypothetical protein
MRSTLLTTAALALMAGTAQANVTFTLKDTGGIGETNILFSPGDTGTPIFGEIDHSGVDVAFSSLTGQTFVSTSNGQADLQANPTPGTTLMTSMNMVAAAGTAWGDVILNMDDAGNPCGGGANTCGTAKITAIDNAGTPFVTDVLMNGSNFVTAIADTVGNPPATPPEFITSIQIQEIAGETNPNFGWTDFKQPRVSGACTLNGSTCTLIPTPEPSSLTVLAGGLLGFTLGWIWRRSRR